MSVTCIWAMTSTACLLMAGCGNSPPVSVEPADMSHLLIQPANKTLPVRLVSELDQTSGEPIIHCPFDFQNDSDQKRLIEFNGAGCSCYGVFVGDRKLKPGDRFEVAPGENFGVVVQASVPAHEVNKDLQAYFLQEDQGAWPRVTLACSARVLADVRLEPILITMLLQPGQTEVARNFSVYHTQRGEFSADIPPTFEGLPDEVTVTSIDPINEPEEIAEGLWRRQWNINLECHLRVDSDIDSPERRLTVSFPGPGNPPRLVESLHLVVRRDLPIRYPREISFGKIHVGETRSRKIFISSVEKEFELKSPAGDSAGNSVAVTILDGTSSRKHYVEVTIKPQTAGALQEEVILTSNLPEIPTLKMGVKALVVDSQPANGEDQPQPPVR